MVEQICSEEEEKAEGSGVLFVLEINNRIILLPEQSSDIFYFMCSNLCVLCYVSLQLCHDGKY